MWRRWCGAGSAPGSNMVASAESTPLPMQQRLRRLAWHGWRALEYARLMRLDRPIGIWLLLWPTLWALWTASAGHPRPVLVLIFIGGTVLMRSAGCVINDLADRNIDPQVRRTRDRPLAARRVSPYEALMLFLVLLALAFLLVLQLDRNTLRLAVIGAVITVTYPLFKRFFPIPQLYLGLCFGWGVPMAFAAVLGRVPRVGWLMLLAAVLWAGIYDTFYAMVDRADDQKIGVRSSAIAFGDLDLLLIGGMQILMLFALLLIGRALELGLWYWLGLLLAAAGFGWQQYLARDRDPAACFRAFLNNHYVGMAIFVGLVLDLSRHR
jgi:4-hydroxybenzoate polyprenyltransferase